LIAECRLDVARIKSDFADVKAKHHQLLQEADMARLVLEAADKKLSDMHHKQQNKLEIAYKSLIKALEAKKKEFLGILRDFYQEQRTMVSFEKTKALSLLQSSKTSQDDLARIEESLEDTHYEELFKILSSKNHEIA